MRNYDLTDYHDELSNSVRDNCGRFCSGCNHEVKADSEGVYMCSTCGSDDLMLYDEGHCTWDFEDIVERIVLESDLDEIDMLEDYNNLLDECHDEVKVCGYSYAPSDALKRLDPVAYDCGYNDHLSSTDYFVEVGDYYYCKEDVLGLIGVRQ
jgi:hypothetical protein